MRSIGLAMRLGIQGVVLLAVAPVQYVSARGGWPLAGRLPVVVHRLFLRLFGVRVRVVGSPPRPGGPVLVLSNHVSWLDIPVIASLVPISFVAKSEIAGWPLVGGLARLQRSIFIDRSRRSATAETNTTIARRLAAGDAVVIFPEGTTGDGLRLLPFRSSLIGAAKAALDTPPLDAVLLQPLALVYSRRRGLPVTRRELPDIAWYGDMELGPHLTLFVRGGPLDVVAVWGEPVRFDAGTDRKRATIVAEAAVAGAIRQVRAGLA